MSHLAILVLIAVAFIAVPLPRTTVAADTTSAVTFRIDVHGTVQEVVIELDETNAPKTCTNFKKLAAQGFYDGIAFHRVIPNYIVQAGDPLTKDASQKHLWGTGGAGYTLQAELGMPHERGSVAMARLGDSVNPKKASSGSQFYIALARLAKLDREYTVFGKVTSGLEYLDQIAGFPVDSNNNPAERVEIVSAAVTRGVVPTTAVAKLAPPAKVPAPADTPPAAKSKPVKKSATPPEPKKSAPPSQVATEPEPKKESWLRKKFGSKKKKAEKVETVGKTEKPMPKVASTAPAKTSDSGASAAVSSDGAPSYRNDNSSDARSAASAPPAASASGDADSLLSDEMNVSSPADDSSGQAYEERGLIGRFLYRYW